MLVNTERPTAPLPPAVHRHRNGARRPPPDGGRVGPALTAGATRQSGRPVTRCQHCRAIYTPAAKHQRFCSDRCRVAAHRATRRRPAAAVATCAHCGEPFRRRNPRQVYCGGSCRTLASRAKRAAAVTALCAWLGLTAEQALDALDIGGLKRAAAALAANGWQYNRAARRWQGVNGCAARAPVR